MLRNLFQAFLRRTRDAKSDLIREAKALTGPFREQEERGLLPRPNYAYGLFRAAGMARFLGRSEVTACEFGVATGNGLVAMIELAERISKETGVRFHIVGFDTGAGLPEVSGYQDHPELWSPGDFAMVNRDDLIKRIAGRAEIRFGDIKDTVDDFVHSLSPSAPLGFVSVDVDIYSASRSALRCLDGDPSLYTPAVSLYFDDVTFFLANRWCGELLAIEEFNAEHEVRKIDRDRSLDLRAAEPRYWHSSMFVAHVLDHEARNRTRDRGRLGLQDHVEFTRAFDLS